MGERPGGWRVLGSGPMADAMRATIEKDPDLYAPETWGMEPVGLCPCCEQRIYSCKTRHTNWDDGFATHANVVHPRMNPETAELDPNGTAPGCCCVAPNWGPKHDGQNDPAPKKRRARKR